MRKVASQTKPVDPTRGSQQFPFVQLTKRSKGENLLSNFNELFEFIN